MNILRKVFVTFKQYTNYDKKPEHNFLGKWQINIQIALYFGKNKVSTVL